MTKHGDRMSNKAGNASPGISRRRVLGSLVAGAFFCAGVVPARAVSRRDDLIGTLQFHEARKTDTLVDLARRFGLGYTEIVAANPDVDPWLPAPGSRIRLPGAHLMPPGPRRGIVINLAQQRLFFFKKTGTVRSYPVSIGREGHETQTGTTRVTGKRKNPIWIPPPSIREDRPELPSVVRPGPENPLGRYALNLGWAFYIIHGTNKPYSIGRRVSYGCIRLYPEDIEDLFTAVAIGTPVTIIDRPVLVGWSGGTLYLEVHPTQQQADELAVAGRMAPRSPGDLVLQVADAAGDAVMRVDWRRVDRIARQRRGVPVALLQA